MIIAHNVTKRFGRITAVEDVNFNLKRGRVIGFLGPNGAGKTTMLRMITGYLPPTSGSITVDSLDVRSAGRSVQRRIGYLPESTPLYAEMRVAEYLQFRARLYGVARRQRRIAIEGAITRCWLQDVRRRPIRQLSKGFRQRVGLAAALLHAPPVLVLDEPTVGLDPAQIREVRSLIRELAGRHTVLLSTHILSEVELTCDEIVMMAGGRIVAQGTVESLRGSAAKRASYVAEVDSDAAADALRALTEVAYVTELIDAEGWRRLTITPTEEAGDLRATIATAMRTINATVRELHREAPSLERLFLHLVTGSDASPGRAHKEVGDA